MRRKRAEKRIRKPDQIYNNILVARFINSIMNEGRKATAEKIFYSSLSLIEEKTKTNPLEVFDKAVNNVMPAIEVRSRRVGGSNYQIPTEIRPDRRTALAIKWILDIFKSQKREKHVTASCK